MQELGYTLLFLTIWFIIPYLAGTWFFKLLRKKWKGLNNNRTWPRRVFNFCVFLCCAFAGWMIEALVLTGVKLMLQ